LAESSSGLEVEVLECVIEFESREEVPGTIRMAWANMEKSARRVAGEVCWYVATGVVTVKGVPLTGVLLYKLNETETAAMLNAPDPYVDEQSSVEYHGHSFWFA
jgi:hypothetical protein